LVWAHFERVCGAGFARLRRLTHEAAMLHALPGQRGRDVARAARQSRGRGFCVIMRRRAFCGCNGGAAFCALAQAANISPLPYNFSTVAVWRACKAAGIMAASMLVWLVGMGGADGTILLTFSPLFTPAQHIPATTRILWLWRERLWRQPWDGACFFA